MKQIIITFLPVTMVAAFAVCSRQFVETPPYAVSTFHPYMVFFLGIIGWFAAALGSIRRSYALFASGVPFLTLCLATGFFPDLWLRWPEATLAALAIGQILVFSISRNVLAPTLRFSATVLLVSLTALIPYLVAIYTAWSPSWRLPIAISAAIVLAIALVLAWLRRQRRLNPLSAITFLFFISLCSLLLFSLVNPGQFDISRRIQIEELMFAALLLVSTVHIAEQLSSEQRLRSGPHMELDASMKDALTNLANRRALELFGPRLIVQSHEAGKAISIIVADIDHFKQVNDTHGHLTGDAVLREIAAQLSQQVRKSDLVVRYGGEEFIVILAGSPLAPALRLAERMRAAIEAHAVQHESLSLRCTASFGVTTAFPENPATLSELIERADANLYRAKRDGRNRVKSDKLISDDF